MYPTVDAFLQHWATETMLTQRVLDGLSDASLEQAVAPGHRTLGRLAWHIAQTIPEMLNHTGLGVTGVDEFAPVPASAAVIASGYAAAAASAAARVQAEWTDASLGEEHAMYGERWTRATILAVLVLHQVHHRGQLTVLMRQAGLTVPGVYGPAAEEWAGIGMEPPVV